MYFKTFAAILISGLATPVLAIDPALPAAPNVTEPAYDWSGAYVGAQLGYGWSDAQLVFPGLTIPEIGLYYPDDYAPLDPGGILGGLYAGYNLATGSGWVLGPEVDFALSNASSEGVGLYQNGAPLLGTTYSFGGSIDWTAAVRARIGYAWDRVLVYGAVGIAAAGITLSHPDQEFGEDAVDPGFDISKTYVGLTAGIGVEMAVTDNLLLRGEYRLTDLGKNTSYVTDNWAGFYGKAQTQDVRFGLAYKF